MHNENHTCRKDGSIFYVCECIYRIVAIAGDAVVVVVVAVAASSYYYRY